MQLIITPTVSYIETDSVESVFNEIKRYLKCDNVFNDEQKIENLNKIIEKNSVVLSKDLYNNFYHLAIENNKLILPTGLINSIHPFIKANVKTMQKQINSAELEVQEICNALRDYQQDIVTTSLNKKRGIIKAATGSGKGVCISELVYQLRKLGTVVIFIPTKALLYQTKEVILNYFTNPIFRGEEKILPEIGLIGDGKKEITEDVLVCIPKSIPGLVNKNAKFKDILNNAPTLILDEIHELSTPGVWDATLNLPNRIYSLGFSATPDSKTPLKLLNRAITGPLLKDITESSMMEQECIYRPNILIYEAPKIKLPTNLVQNYRQNWAQAKIYNIAIVNNAVRNKIIVKAVIDFLERDARPLIIIVERVSTTSTSTRSHAEILQELLLIQNKDYLKEIPIIHGKSKDARLTISKLKEGSVRVIIAGPKAVTAGLDIPNVGGVALAGAMRKDNASIQRIGRALRLDTYDSSPTIIDIKDTTYPYSDQATHRINLYRTIYGNDAIDFIK